MKKNLDHMAIFQYKYHGTLIFDRDSYASEVRNQLTRTDGWTDGCAGRWWLTRPDPPIWHSHHHRATDDD
jgi:hypothetical protein